MRTKEKPSRNTYTKTKNSKTNRRYKSTRRANKSSHSKRIRQICIKCTLSVAVFTLTLTCAASWQVLKMRMNNWKNFSAEATTLLLPNLNNDTNENTKRLPIRSADSGDLEPSGSSEPASSSEPSKPSEPDGSLEPSGSSDLSGTSNSSDFVDTPGYSETSEFSEVHETSRFSEPGILREEQLADTTADTESSEHIASVSDDWNLILVNPWNPIPENYEINLAPLPNGHSIDQRCYPELMEMLADCRAEGLSPLICSSYRTLEKQETLFKDRMDELTAQGYSQKEARKKAATSVARPGTSEHQVGLAVDIVDSSYQYLNSSQEYTKVQQWLMKNSWKYGFILRYPSEKSYLTGIIYEPWHYRYVGKEAAEEIYNREICLEEYLEEHFQS